MEDVVRAIADALGEQETFGQSYELCGPTIYSLRELIELTGRICGRTRPIIGNLIRASTMRAAPAQLVAEGRNSRDGRRYLRQSGPADRARS